MDTSAITVRAYTNHQKGAKTPPEKSPYNTNYFKQNNSRAGTQPPLNIQHDVAQHTIIRKSEDDQPPPESAKSTQQPKTTTTQRWNAIVERWNPPVNKIFPVPTLQQLAHTALDTSPISINSVSRQPLPSHHTIYTKPNKLQKTKMDLSKTQAWTAFLETHLRARKDKRLKRKKPMPPISN